MMRGGYSLTGWVWDVPVCAGVSRCDKSCTKGRTPKIIHTHSRGCPKVNRRVLPLTFGRFFVHIQWDAMAVAVNYEYVGLTNSDRFWGYFNCLTLVWWRVRARCADVVLVHHMQMSWGRTRARFARETICFDAICISSHYCPLISMWGTHVARLINGHTLNDLMCVRGISD